MSYPRLLPIFDAREGRGSWNEQMIPGEYAVHYSSFEGSAVEPYCTVFGDLETAEAHARMQAAERPSLRCAIYDHQGMVGAPLREVRGAAYKGDSGLSPRFRRWGGSVLFFGGACLLLLDWRADFRLSWPAMIGSRMIVPGLVLLVIEAMLVLHARMADRRLAAKGTR